MAWAANRYTEARLDNICSEFFRDIDQDTVDFADNYDGSMKEPTLPPTTLPQRAGLLQHGHRRGHGLNICGFNLGEVCDATIEFLKTRSATCWASSNARTSPRGRTDSHDGGELSTSTTGGEAPSGPISDAYLGENLIEIYEIPYSHHGGRPLWTRWPELIKSGKE